MIKVLGIQYDTGKFEAFLEKRVIFANSIQYFSVKFSRELTELYMFQIDRDNNE